MTNGDSASKTPSWQSTAVALLLIVCATGIFIVVYLKGGVDDALKAWGGVGVVAGIIIGAVPAWFFTHHLLSAADQRVKEARNDVERERKRRDDAEAKASIVLGLADEKTVRKAREENPELFRRQL